MELHLQRLTTSLRPCWQLLVKTEPSRRPPTQPWVTSWATRNAGIKVIKCSFLQSDVKYLGIQDHQGWFVTSQSYHWGSTPTLCKWVDELVNIPALPWLLYKVLHETWRHVLELEKGTEHCYWNVKAMLKSTGSFCLAQAICTHCMVRAASSHNL